MKEQDEFSFVSRSGVPS